MRIAAIGSLARRKLTGCITDLITRYGGAQMPDGAGATRDALSRFYARARLNNGTRDPDEIALAITAEIVSLRRAATKERRI
jgi:hypothetical protein